MVLGGKKTSGSHARNPMKRKEGKVSKSHVSSLYGKKQQSMWTGPVSNFKSNARKSRGSGLGFTATSMYSQANKGGYHRVGTNVNHKAQYQPSSSKGRSGQDHVIKESRTEAQENCTGGRISGPFKSAFAGGPFGCS